MNKLRLMTIIGTRPEIIRLSTVIKKCDKYFDQILVHTGQNYDYNLNQVFFEDRSAWCCPPGYIRAFPVPSAIWVPSFMNWPGLSAANAGRFSTTTDTPPATPGRRRPTLPDIAVKAFL